MILLPAIDLAGGRCVRLTEGRADAATVYDGHALDIARDWLAAGATWVHVVDLDGAFAGARTPNRDLAVRIATEVGLAVEFGGGLRTPGDARDLLARGVARVVLGTMAVEDPAGTAALLEEASDRVAIGIDARDGIVMVRGWEESSGRPAADLAREMARLGARRFVYTDIARDGTLAGPNLAALRAFAREAGVPVVASGGVASLADLAALRALAADGVDAVIVGKALHEGRLGIREAIEALA